MSASYARSLAPLPTPYIPRWLQNAPGKRLQVHVQLRLRLREHGGQLAYAPLLCLVS